MGKENNILDSCELCVAAYGKSINLHRNNMELRFQQLDKRQKYLVRNAESRNKHQARSVCAAINIEFHNITARG